MATLLRISTDDYAGTICGSVAEGAFTNDPGEIDLGAAAASYGLTNKQHDGAMPYYAVAASQVENLEADGITEASTSQVDEIRDYYT